MSHEPTPGDKPKDYIIEVDGKKIASAMPVIETWLKGLQDIGLNPWEVLHLINYLHLTMQAMGQERGQPPERIRTFLQWSGTQWKITDSALRMQKGNVN